MFYFTVDDGVHGAELWRSDGTADQTQLVTDFRRGTDGLFDAYACGSFFFCLPFVPGSNGTFYFTPDYSRESIFVSDGTETGTRLLHEDFVTDTALVGIAFVNQRLLYATVEDDNEDEDLIITRFWTIGEGETRTKLRSFRHGRSGGKIQSPQFQVLGNQVLFAANDGLHGRELWRSDGTVAGTKLVRDLAGSDGDSTPFYLSSAGERVFFFARDPLHGVELHRSDGAEAGTEMVRDINPGRDDGFEPYVGAPHPIAAGDHVYFAANDGTYGVELWKTDGTDANTVLVKDISPGSDGSFPSQLVAAGEYVFFLVRELSGLQLWRSDGTELGTIRVSGEFENEGTPDMLTSFREYLYFANRRGLWVSDGTEGGTMLVQSLPGIQEIEAVNDTLFLSVAEQSQGALWISDGTVSGTHRIETFRRPSLPTSFTQVGDRTFFAAAFLGGGPLWRTDGTTEGTVSLTSPGRLPPFADATELTSLGDRLLFSAERTIGYNDRELWRSDGTEGGTVLVLDIAAEEMSSDPRYLKAVNGHVLFGAQDGTSGRELWLSDGTANGTRRLRDIAAGEPSSDPTELTVAGSHVFFSADDGVTGRELWAVPLSTIVAPHCGGDCDVSGFVSVDELITAVNVALGKSSIDRCDRIDQDDDRHATVDEIVVAVGNAIRGCPP